MSNNLTIREPHTATDWTNLNPVLEQFEMGFEIDPATGAYTKAKIGDGVTAWNDLSYFSPTGDGVQTVYVASRTLTNAEIKALPTTGIELVPAQGVNTLCVPVSYKVYLDNSAGGYTNCADANWDLYSDDVAAAVAADALTAAWPLGVPLAAPSIYGYTFPCQGALYPGSGTFAGQTFGLSTVLANKGIVIKDKWNGSDYTGGHNSNTAKIIIHYTVDEVS
jgi:hypothetical protein